MSVINTQPLIGASGNQGVASYNLTKSLRFRSSATAYLSRTQGTATNNKKFSLSFWVKRGSLGSARNIISAGVDGDNFFEMYFTASDQISIENYTGVTYQLRSSIASKFRDPAAWYHIVFVYDSAQATASNRALIYVNGANNEFEDLTNDIKKQALGDK